MLNTWMGGLDLLIQQPTYTRNINDSRSKDIWNAKDCAADNYPFMVLSSALLDRDLLRER